MTNTSSLVYAGNKRKHGIKIISILLTIMMLVGCFGTAFPVLAADTIVAQGQCGDDAFWKITEDGNDKTFTVYGSGDMWDRTEWEGDVFDAYTVTSIVLEEGITSVGEYAFGRQNIGTIQQSDSSKYGGSFQFGVNDYYTKPFENATGSIVIPESVKKIERGAFSYCTGLTGSLTLPDRLEKIENSAFSNSGITGDIVIPDSVTSIGDFAFQYCTGINGTLTLSNNLEYLGTLAFGHCTYMTGTVVIPDSLTVINSSAFYYAQFITKIELGKNVVSIGQNAFEQCERAKGILVIPDSVESIGSCAFMNCKKLEGVQFGNSVKSIGYWAFAQCQGMTGTLELPDSLESLGQDVFHQTARYQVGHYGTTYNGKLENCNVYNFFEHYRNPDDRYQFIRVAEGEHVEPTETKDGRQTYYIYCNDPSHTSDVLLMTVNEPIKRPITYVTEIFVSPTEMTMEIGMSQQITASVGPENASNKAITYISNDRNIATVDRNGVVKAIAAGTTTITVSPSDGTEISKTVTVTVLPQHVCTPGEPVHQDDFRDDENGYYSFDLVTYCTKDGNRIKTEMVDLERVEEKQPTETEDGNIEYFTVKSRSDGSSDQILLYDYTVYTFDNDTQTYVECNLGNIIDDDLDGYVFYYYSVDEERYVELDIQSLIDECDADDSKYYIAGDGYFSVYREELITDPNDPIYDKIFVWDPFNEVYIEYDGDVTLYHTNNGNNDEDNSGLFVVGKIVDGYYTLDSEKNNHTAFISDENGNPLTFTENSFEANEKYILIIDGNAFVANCDDNENLKQINGYDFDGPVIIEEFSPGECSYFGYNNGLIIDPTDYPDDMNFTLPITIYKVYQNVELEVEETMSVDKIVLPLDTVYNEDNSTVTVADQNIASYENGQIKGLQAGTTTMTVTIITDENVEIAKTVNITVKAPAIVPVTNISVSTNNIAMKIGDTDILDPVVTPENASNPALTYVSSDPNIVTVDGNGTVTAVGNGNAVISIISQENESIRTDVNVLVYDADAFASYDKTTLNEGENAILSVEVIPSNILTVKKVEASSSDLTVATVDDDGNVTAVKSGCVAIVLNITLENENGEEFVITKMIEITVNHTEDQNSEESDNHDHEHNGFRCSKCDWYDENKNKLGGFGVIVKIIHVIVHFVESLNKLS